MSLEVVLREEVPADCPAVERVTVAAFEHAAHTSHTEHRIVAALRRAGALTLSLVAETDGVIVGHVAVSPVSISAGAARWFGLGPLSVTPGYQRRGIGARLVLEALRLLRSRGAGGCVVLGEPEYYGRFGFRVVPELVFPGAPRPYFQAACFVAAAPHGVVAYHAAFEVA